MNQEKKRLNLIGLILLAQAIVLSLATTLFAEILQNDVWIGIASTLIALLIPCFFMGFKNLKKHLTATHHTITFTTILFLLSIIYTTNYSLHNMGCCAKSSQYYGIGKSKL